MTKIKSGFHFKKDQPSESHVIVQAWNDGGTASKLFDNKTAVPSAGDFEATEILTDDSGAGVGVFSRAPGGNMVYVNGKGTYIWGGDELRVGSFINYNPDDSFIYDFTDVVQNNLSDSDNVATLTSTGGGIDSDVMLMLHLENNVTDSSPATAHTVTNNNVTFTTGVIGSYRAEFNGTNAYLTVPDNADFDLSGGTWTVDAQVQVDDLDNVQSIYYQQTDANNYIHIFIDTSGAVNLSIYDTAAEVLGTGFKTADDVISAGTNYHIEVVENEDDYYIFVDGVMQAYLSDSSRAANYTGVVQIGYDGANFFDGKIDEYRVSDTARHTSNFEKPSAAYTDSGTKLYFYVGATRALNGFKIYVGTANTSTSTMSAYYWDGSDWTAVSSLSDGTTAGGKSLAQTGSVTFTSTDGSAKLRMIEGALLYWYKVEVSAMAATTSVYYVTVSAPMQEIKDIWDGIDRVTYSFQEYHGAAYKDFTSNVYDDGYSSADTSSYAGISTLTTASALYAGFVERTAAVSFSFTPGAVNGNTATVAVYYWNGAAWISVGSVQDGTADAGKSFAKSGTVSWTPPSKSSEFKRDIAGGIPLYYYKFVFSATVSASIQIYHVAGIPAQREIGAYNYAAYAGNSVWLLGEVNGYKNRLIRGYPGAADIWNGDLTLSYYIGDETDLVAGAGLYMQLGSNLYEAFVVCKARETWMVVPTSDGYSLLPVSHEIGCVAPLTMKTASFPAEGGRVNVCIWQGSDGVYMFDGKTPIRISGDIQNFFDPNESDKLNQTYIQYSTAFYDSEKQEYHWIFASGTSATPNREFAYDLKRSKWYEIDRGTGKALACGIEASDTAGNPYVYGATGGYIERLEYGTTFDGNAIIQTVRLGDLALRDGHITDETRPRSMKLVCASKTTTSSNINVTYYKDGNTTAQETFTMSPSSSGYRIAQPEGDLGSGPATFHSFNLSLSTSDETYGFEPIFLGILYKYGRQGG